MILWWFARRCRIRKTALPGLLPMVWLAATAIIGVNASALRGLSSIIWFTNQAVQLYLSAVCHLQTLCIGRDPLLEAHPLLNYALRGHHRCPVSKKPRPRLPITPAILQKISSFGHIHHISVSIYSRTTHAASPIIALSSALVCCKT